MIFEKTQVWKAFIEMSSPKEAEAALLNLNNLNLFNCQFDGKMTIEYSNLVEEIPNMDIFDGRGSKKN